MNTWNQRQRLEINRNFLSSIIVTNALFNIYEKWSDYEIFILTKYAKSKSITI